MRIIANRGKCKGIDKNSVYNLKRRIASLPPIPVEIFCSQVLNFDTQNGDTEAPWQSPQLCIACEQRYTNRKAWQTHLKSQNHAEKTAGFNTTAPVASNEQSSPQILSLDPCHEVQPADEEGRSSTLQCLFCNIESTTLDSNLIHMSHAHSFFIPNAEYLIDMESFLQYLVAIVSVFRECIFCGSARSTKFGVQDHMRGKGHCKLDFEDDEHELRQFYDFSEDVDGSREALGEEVTLIPLEEELHLPSGKTLGHRSRTRHLRRSHPQNNSSSPSSRQHVLTKTKSESVVMGSKDQRIATRAGTSTSLIGLTEVQQRSLMAAEKKTLKLETMARNEYQSGVEKGGNRQKRFKVRGLGKKRGGLEKVLG